MNFYEGNIFYDENEFIVYFDIGNSQHYIFIIIGKTPKDTYKELAETRKVLHGASIKIKGEIDYYSQNGEDDEAFFCQQSDLPE